MGIPASAPQLVYQNQMLWCANLDDFEIGK